MFFRIFVLTHDRRRARRAASSSPRSLAKANNRKEKLPINVAPFAGQSSVRFYVQATGNDNERYPAIASAAATLS